MDLVLVPVHMPGHWILLVLDINRSAIVWYDSLGGKADKSHVKVIVDFIAELAVSY